MYNVTQIPEYLEADTTASGSTVGFSELGSTFTTMADNATLAITPSSTPNMWVSSYLTANRIYLSSNDYNANSDKDGSHKMSLVYQRKYLSRGNPALDMT